MLGRTLSSRSFLSEASEAYTAASAPVVVAASEPLTCRKFIDLVNMAVVFYLIENGIAIQE